MELRRGVGRLSSHGPFVEAVTDFARFEVWTKRELQHHPEPRMYHIGHCRAPHHLRRFLDAVLQADSALKSINAVSSLSDNAFRFLTPICIVFHSRSFFKSCAFEWVQSSSSS
uniref:Uncharacterized protein n=1 Tax=Eutreptiella gymnastica TaxID=73025 RepID=A0A7S4D1U0_9EUGL